MRTCPICHHTMKENCYLEDVSKPLNDYVIIEKTEDLKKIKHPLKTALCPECGHIELYVDMKNAN